jgi:stage V sporulation protein S
VLKAIGAGAINQAMKSIPIAKSFVASYGIRLLTDPVFFHGDVEDDGKTEKIQGLAIRVFRA